MQRAMGPGIALIAVSGPPLIGKSTLARGISETLGIQAINVDDVRAQILPKSSGVLHTIEEEANFMMASYQEMYRLAGGVLEGGRSVIVDATHSKEKYHDMIVNLALKEAVPLIVVLLDTAKISNLDLFLAERMKYRETNGDSKSSIKGQAGIERVRNDDYRRFKAIGSGRVYRLIIADPNLPITKLVAQVSEELKRCLTEIKRGK